MHKNILFLLFILVHSIGIAGAQNRVEKANFSELEEEQVALYLQNNELDSAYRFLNQFSSDSTPLYLAWTKLAYNYWQQGDLVNASGIAFWLKKKTELFSTPNELYPQVHHLIGNIYYAQIQFDSAISNYKQAVNYRENYTHIHDTSLLDTYQNIALVAAYAIDSANAFYYLQKAKDIVYLQQENIEQIASIKRIYGYAYAQLKYYALAEEYFQDALSDLSPDNPNHLKELSSIYNELGRLYLLKGGYSAAINFYTKAKFYLIQNNASDFELFSLSKNIAGSYYLLKDYNEALKIYLETYESFTAVLNAENIKVVNLETNIATVYKGIGDYDQAIKYFKLASSKKTLSPAQYRVFGEVLWKAKRLDEAEAMLKYANSRAENNKESTKVEIADTHFWLGSFYLQTGRNNILGLYYLNLAVGVYRSELGDKNEPLGRALLAQAKYFIKENDTDKALDIIQESIISLTPGFFAKDPLVNPEGIEIRLQSVANSLGWKAQALAQKYDKSKDLRYLKSSFDTYSLSLKMVQAFRLSQKYNTNIILNEEVNNLLNQAIQVAYKLYSITSDTAYFNATFSFIEQNKSTALLASLQQNDSIRLANVPKRIIEKENSLKQELLSIQEKLNPLLGAKFNDQEVINSLDKQKKFYQSSLDSVQNILALEHPDYYRLFYGNNQIEIKDVQQELAPNKVLLDYAITDSTLLVFVVSKNKANVYAKKKPVNFTNSMLRLLQLLRYVNTDNSYADYTTFVELAHQNYQFLLGDFEEDIKGKELLIVPDGILSYLPFDVLLTDTVEKARPDYRNLPYLINQNVSSTLNSAAIYFSYSKNKKPNYGQIVAFAPDYSFFEQSDSLQTQDYLLMPLTHVKRELTSISELFNPIIFKGEKATKANFLESAGDASVLHLAMHTVLNDDEPLNSELVFSGTSQIDSKFKVGELFGMDLSADLAVLSACNSGNGRLNKGEGIMSLSTGFQYAGVPSVVMTHWDVNDKYSADLMASFYQYLALGNEKNVALRQAKVDLIKRGNAISSHPYYWAGFTLIGNEAAIVSKKSNWGRTMEFVVPIFIVLVLFIRKRKRPNG